MLGIDYNRASSYPVGYVDYLRMNSLDFEEYLWAMGITDDMIDMLRECFDKRKVIPTTVHDEMMKYFRSYMAIGGMPEVVATFVESRDYRIIDKLQRNLLMGYQYDIGHYASSEEKIKAEKCYMSLGKQLLDKENYKFQYKEVEKGRRAQKYFSSIEWLIRADIVNISRRVTDIRYSLEDYAVSVFFRLYVSDLSLLIAMRDFELKRFIVENTIVGDTKGGLYESVIADILHKNGYELYFYKNDTTRKEIDLLIQKDGYVIPIEVKGGNNTAVSLNSIMKKYPNIDVEYKFIDGNMGVGDNGVITAPLYAAMFI